MWQWQGLLQRESRSLYPIGWREGLRAKTLLSKYDFVSFESLRSRAYGEGVSMHFCLSH